MIQPAPTQAEDVAQVILVDAPWRSRALFGPVVGASLNVAGTEVFHPGSRGRQGAAPGSHLANAFPVHGVQRPADECSDQVSFERPRCIDVAEDEREIGNAREHQALVLQSLAGIDGLTVNDQIDAAVQLQYKAGRGDDNVGFEFHA